MARDTAKFLRLMNSANEAIANWVAEEARETGGGDPVRIQRDIERRDKAGGTLRARERPRARPIRARFVLTTRSNPVVPY